MVSAVAVPARCSLATLGVVDVEQATRFYEALGWRRSSASVEGVVSFFDLAGAVLALYRAEDLAADSGRPGEVPDPLAFRGVALAINVDEPDDVARVLTEVAAAGGTVVAPAAQADWGGMTGGFHDVDGHVWEVAWNPGFPIGPDGRPQLP